MSKNKKNKTKTEIQPEEDVVAFVPGSSIIDIGELRRAQAVENLLLDENLDDKLEDQEADLDQEARLLREEIDNDPEMKIDVLAGFEEADSDETMDNIAAKVAKQSHEDYKTYQKLAGEVSEELKHLNDTFIEEDKALESEVAAEAAASTTFESLDFSDAEDADEVEDMSEEDAALKAALPQMDADGNIDLEDLAGCIEALLFYSDRSVSIKKLKEMLEMPDMDNGPIVQAVGMLNAEFSKRTHGFEIAEIAGGYQLRTKQSKAPLLRKLAKVQVQRLSRGAMETLTIIAYKQPCTKDDIDIVRGVDSSHFMRTLLDRSLVEVTGRSEAAGRPMIYATTDKFLEVFGLMDLNGLPPLREIEAMVPSMAAAEEGAEDPRVIQMRKMVHQMKAESNHLDYSAKEDEIILQEIRDKVKAIDITTPYLERQKALAEQGITGEEAEMMLAKEFGFAAQAPTEESAAPEPKQEDMDFMPDAADAARAAGLAAQDASSSDEDESSDHEHEF